jgi:hypothetical protein
MEKGHGTQAEGARDADNQPHAAKNQGTEGQAGSQINMGTLTGDHGTVNIKWEAEVISQAGGKEGTQAALVISLNYPDLALFIQTTYNVIGSAGLRHQKTLAPLNYIELVHSNTPVF